MITENNKFDLSTVSRISYETMFVSFDIFDTTEEIPTKLVEDQQTHLYDFLERFPYFTPYHTLALISELLIKGYSEGTFKDLKMEYRLTLIELEPLLEDNDSVDPDDVTDFYAAKRAS